MLLIKVWLPIILLLPVLTSWRFGVCIYLFRLKYSETIGKATTKERPERMQGVSSLLILSSSVFFFLCLLHHIAQPWVSFRVSFSSLGQSLSFFAFINWLHFILDSAFIIFLNPFSPLYALSHSLILRLYHLLSKLLQ